MPEQPTSTILPSTKPFPRRLSLLLPVLLLGGALLAFHFLRRGGGDPLVVYCAHDAVFAEEILRAFERRTGIPVAVRYDAEATKSLGLVEQLLRESPPRADVFWNNEPLGTIALAEAGRLAPHRGAGWARIPAAYRDPEGRWAGFAARLRVWIVNMERLPAEPGTPARILAGPDLSRVAIAKPLYGTTLTHYAALRRVRGAEALTAWHRDLVHRGARIVNGNAAVQRAVAEGICDLGLTDTDDYFAAKDAGKPVGMLPARLDDGRTVCIPNTVAILAGTPRESAAEALADYLLSADVELALANGPSRQIPLGPVAEDRLPAEVRALRGPAAEGIPPAEIAPERAACLAWLKAEVLE